MDELWVAQTMPPKVWSNPGFSTGVQINKWCAAFGGIKLRNRIRFIEFRGWMPAHTLPAIAVGLKLDPGTEAACARGAAATRHDWLGFRAPVLAAGTTFSTRAVPAWQGLSI